VVRIAAELVGSLRWEKQGCTKVRGRHGQVGWDAKVDLKATTKSRGSQHRRIKAGGQARWVPGSGQGSRAWVELSHLAPTCCWLRWAMEEGPYTGGSLDRGLNRRGVTQMLAHDM
jgi:hypothetical protein